MKPNNASNKEVMHKKITTAAYIQSVIQDPNVYRQGLENTPDRVVKAWGEDWGAGYGQDPMKMFTQFSDGAEECGDELILVSNIPVYSHCEHHLAPFWGLAHIGYLPDKKILGLSKFCRLVDVFAKRLQVQERLTNQIATTFYEGTQALAVGVILECRHMCMESRGVAARGTITTTSALRGIMQKEKELRAEFLTLAINASATKKGL